MEAAKLQAQVTYNATINTAVPFHMEYIASLVLYPSVSLLVSSESIVYQTLPTNMAFSSASASVPNSLTLAVKSNRPNAALSSASLSTGFSLSTVGSSVSFTVTACDVYGNVAPEWFSDAAQVIHSKVTAMFDCVKRCTCVTLSSDLHRWIHKRRVLAAFHHEILFDGYTCPRGVCCCRCCHGGSINTIIWPRSPSVESSRRHNVRSFRSRHFIFQVSVRP